MTKRHIHHFEKAERAKTADFFLFILSYYFWKPLLQFISIVYVFNFNNIAKVFSDRDY